MLRANIRLFRVKGIPVGINWTWVFVFLLVFWSLAAQLFPSTYPDLSGMAHVLMALVATVLFFASILVHELSHTLRSLREGAQVREVTLWLFGGVSRAEEPLPSAGAEFRVVAAGPLSTGVLALVFLGLAALARAADWSDAVVGVPDYLARINGLLLAFNLVPALPLDGGRLLHAVLWRRSGDRAAATISAAVVGRAFAFLLIAVGLVSLLGGGGIGGIWLAFIGWFVLQAVQEEVFSAHLEQAVSGLSVRDLMARDPVTVAPDTTIDEFARTVARRSPHGAYPVLDHGRLVGLLPSRRAAGVARSERGSVTVADVMLTGEDVPVVHPDQPMLGALDALRREPGRAVVLDGDTGDEVVGLLSTSDAAHALEVAPQRRERPGREVVPERRERPARRARFGIWLVAAVVIAVAVGAVYHPPYAVIAPGDSFDIRRDIAISGVPVQQPTGPYMLTSVRLSQPSALGLLVDVFRSDREIVSVGDVVPSDVSPGEVQDFERQLFLDSQRLAAAAAARAAGYRATVTGSGAQVIGLMPSSPAASALEVDDVITAVDGATVATTTDLQRAVSGRPAGQRLTLTVVRDGTTRDRRVRTANLPQVSGGTGIGVVTETRDLRVELPFTLRLRERPGIGGPSAGLAYALAMTDMLDRRDDARSRAIAATGTVAANGSVGPVGGVHEKAIAARDAGAELFLVPSDELSSVDESDLEARGVTNLEDAVGVLAAA